MRATLRLERGLVSPQLPSQPTNDYVVSVVSTEVWVPMRVLIADDHEIVRRGVRSLLSADPECQICGEAVDAVTRAQELKPDLVVMDINMPNLNGLEATRKVRELLPHTKILVLSQHDSPEMKRQAIRAGAGATVCKSSMTTDLLAGIKKLRDGEAFVEHAVTTPPVKFAKIARLFGLTLPWERCAARRGSLNTLSP